MKIGNLEISGEFFLAPMEAVNCASFRLLCEKRGAAIVYTDMIDADHFVEYLNETNEEETIAKYINPQGEKLAIQLGGRNIDNLVKTMNVLEKHALFFDFNAGCPLPYMLGKKGGVYLMKHPDQLYKIITELRAATSKPFTVKLRSGWDKDSINALEIAKNLKGIGVDAIAIHARTRKQKYEKKSDWNLVREMKKELDIPIILSGDVFNAYLAKKAFQHTKCDFIMIGRAAKNNPSIFIDLQKYAETSNLPERVYDKKTAYVKADFKDFLELYKTKENRYKFSEIRDHSLWFAKDCRINKEITQKIMSAETEEDLQIIFETIQF